MHFNGSSLNEMSLDDLRLLVENHIPESQHLEFKQMAYGRQPEDRREMLRDIVALANAEGGYLVIGVQEDNSSRAARLTPVDNPFQVAQAMRQACIDGIRERVEGIEVKPFETGFNQGLVVVHVPKSQQRPHMMIVDSRTDFYRRYDTDKRAMTISEIRELVMADPLFRRLVELEIQKGQSVLTPMDSNEYAPPYVQLLKEHPVEKFLQRYFLGGAIAQTLVLVSPFISDLEGSAFSLEAILKKIQKDKTCLYIITQPPHEEYQRSSMAILNKSPYVEIRYNPDVHAKLFVCWSREERESFALFGSGNLTKGGLRHNIELGMMIFPRGYGKTLLRELYNWGSVFLRSTSSCEKSLNIPRREK